MVLEFTIPRGSTTCCEQKLDLLSAYSTPPQVVVNGGTLIFDRNLIVFGNAISHDLNSPDFEIAEPGVYYVSFKGSFASLAGSCYPQSLLLYLAQDGDIVAGSELQHTFARANDLISLSFTIPIVIYDTPSTLSIGAQGGSFAYSNIALSIYRIGDIPEEA